MHSNLVLVNLDLVNIGSDMKNLADFQFVCHFVTIEDGLFYMSKIDIKNNSKRPSKWILTLSSGHLLLSMLYDHGTI